MLLPNPCHFKDAVLQILLNWQSSIETPVIPLEHIEHKESVRVAVIISACITYLCSNLYSLICALNSHIFHRDWQNHKCFELSVAVAGELAEEKKLCCAQFYKKMVKSYYVV